MKSAAALLFMFFAWVMGEVVQPVQHPPEPGQEFAVQYFGSVVQSNALYFSQTGKDLARIEAELTRMEAQVKNQ